MSKLSKKAATDIAALFNSIDVAGMMKVAVANKRDAGEITGSQYVEDIDLWNNHAYEAARELYRKYGILPVSLEEEARS